ncbi:hypothetical protein GCK32_009491 [Trichostrongylus colubriformis]|uniref:Uncharacterized protein n=1 Tax=Trichostrongylus colubriformis TaxID=6319 RepID=A0AAN8FT27_TRICO
MQFLFMVLALILSVAAVPIQVEVKDSDTVSESPEMADARELAISTPETPSSVEPYVDVTTPPSTKKGIQRCFPYIYPYYYGYYPYSYGCY